MNSFWLSSGIVTLAVLAAQSSRGQTIYTIGDLGSWNISQQITGCQQTSGGGLEVGQTFSLPGNAQVDSITVPVYWDSSQAAQNQGTLLSVNIAAWNGTSPTGPVLYQGILENYNIPGVPSLGMIPGWQTFTGNPSNLILNQNQQYVLYLASATYLQFVTSEGYTDGSAYTGGTYVSYDGYGDWRAAGTPVDMAFSMQLTSVPEPSSTALAVAGLVTWLRWRRRDK
jgi:hypothetical protein